MRPDLMVMTEPERSMEMISGARGRRYAMLIIMLSLLCGLAGNLMLSTIGILSGMMLCRGTRGVGPLVPLTFITAVLAMMQLVFATSMFAAILAASPDGVCARSGRMVQTFGPTTASNHATGLSPPSPPPLPYPYNMTTRATGEYPRTRLIALLGYGAPNAFARHP